MSRSYLRCFLITISSMSLSLFLTSMPVSGQVTPWGKNIKKLQGQVEALKSKIEEIESHQEQLQKELLEKLPEKIKDIVENRIADIEEGFQMSETESKASLQSLNKKLAAFQGKVTRLEEQHLKDQEDLRAITSTTITLITDLEESIKAQFDDMKRQTRAGLKASLEALKEDVRKEIGILEVRLSLESRDAIEKKRKEIDSEMAFLRSTVTQDIEQNKKEFRNFETSIQEIFDTFAQDITNRLVEGDRRLADRFSLIADNLQEKEMEIASVTTTMQKHAEERKAEIASLEEKVLKVIEERNREVSSLTSAISENLQGKGKALASLGSSLLEIQNRLEEKEREIASLKKNVATSLDKTDTELASLEAVITQGLRENSKQLSSSMSVLSTEFEKRDAELVPLEKAINNLDKRLLLLSDRLAPLEGKDSEQLSSSVATLSKEFKKRDAAFASLKKAINNLDKRLHLLSHRLASLEKEFKKSAATPTRNSVRSRINYQ